MAGFAFRFLTALRLRAFSGLLTSRGLLAPSRLLISGRLLISRRVLISGRLLPRSPSSEHARSPVPLARPARLPPTKVTPLRAR